MIPDKLFDYLTMTSYISHTHTHTHTHTHKNPSLIAKLSLRRFLIIDHWLLLPFPLVHVILFKQTFLSFSSDFTSLRMTESLIP